MASLLENLYTKNIRKIKRYILRLKSRKYTFLLFALHLLGWSRLSIKILSQKKKNYRQWSHLVMGKESAATGC